jgi:carboxyl-terminal processing protease
MSTTSSSPAEAGRGRATAGLAVCVVGAMTFLGGVMVGASNNRPAEGAPRQSVMDEAAQRIASQAQKPVTTSTLERAAVQGMLKALGDKWAAFYSPQEYSSFTSTLEGRYTGVGIWVQVDASGSTLIYSVQPASPAARAGLRAGDVIIAIGGQRVTGESVAAVTQMLHGASGTKVAISVTREGKARTMTVTRQVVSTGDVELERLPHGVLQIKIAAFSRGVGAAVISAMKTEPADHANGVILDLRGNPGGLVDEAVAVAGAFLDGGPVVSYQTRSGTQVLTAPRGGDTRTPLVLLVDGGTASAAEIVAGAMQDRDRAVVVGSRTYGKGSVQEPTTLSDGSAIELTIGHYLTPSGRSLDGVGIDPDIIVASDASQSDAVSRGLEVLTGLAASLGPTGRG